jgi:hypothetical protein
MSGWVGIVADEIAHPGARPGQAGADRGRADPENLGGLARLQPFPDGEGQHLPVHLAQSGQRGLDGEPFGHLAAGVRRDGGDDPLPEPITEPLPAQATAAVVGEHAPGDAVQPQPDLCAHRDLMAAAPGDEEGLGDDVGRILGLLDAPQGVRQERREVDGVDAPEAVLLLGLGAHVHPMSGRVPIVTGRSRIPDTGT